MLELLSPAGSPEAVVAAVQNGADAVYMGLGIFNARRGAKNFSDEEFEKAVRYCRIRDCKVYVTMNTLVGDREMEQAVEIVLQTCRNFDFFCFSVFVCYGDYIIVVTVFGLRLHSCRTAKQYSCKYDYFLHSDIMVYFAFSIFLYI